MIVKPGTRPRFFYWCCYRFTYLNVSFIFIDLFITYTDS